jgi:hypothetical protein
MLIKRTLTITVEYETNDLGGDEIPQLERNLTYIATHAHGNGMITDNTEAVVESWDYKVK